MCDLVQHGPTWCNKKGTHWDLIGKRDDKLVIHKPNNCDLSGIDI